MTEPARLFLFGLAYAAVGWATGFYMARVWPEPGRMHEERTARPAATRPPAPTITVWVTKDIFGDQVTFADAPRDDGVIGEHRVPDPAPDEVLVIATQAGGIVHYRSYQPGEWHRTKDAAVAQAERMRAERVAEMEREIRALKAKEFRP